MKIGIYAVSNKINKRMYIGQATDIDKRWKQHKSYGLDKDFKKQSFGCRCLYYDMRKYGLDAFEFIILEEVACYDSGKINYYAMAEAETRWIQSLKDVIWLYNYNLNPLDQFLNGNKKRK